VLAPTSARYTGRIRRRLLFEETLVIDWADRVRKRSPNVGKRYRAMSVSDRLRVESFHLFRMA